MFSATEILNARNDSKKVLNLIKEPSNNTKNKHTTIKKIIDTSGRIDSYK